VSARILICHGADDSFVPKEHVDAFKKEMADANVDYRFISYAGAVHAFTNPDADTYAKQFGIPIGYNEAADKHSWADMQQFFRDVFKR
jgi:dienelactone hydrolase